MAYVDTINKQSVNYPLTGFQHIFICTTNKNDAKTVTFPDGYNNEGNLAFKVLFVNGHSTTGYNIPITLNEVNGDAVPIVANVQGTLTPLSAQYKSGSEYKVLQPNTCLELYHTDDYDGNNAHAYVIIGNPVVLSSNQYTIYSDGYHVASQLSGSNNGNNYAIWVQ